MNADTKLVFMKNISFFYKAESDFSLHIPQFDIDRGQSTLLLGESGSGKSTLLNLICGALKADEGDVWVNAQNMTDLAIGQRDLFRAENIGIIFQQFNLLPFASVRDNILLPLAFAKKRQQNISNIDETLDEMMKKLQLAASLLQQKAGELSIGQQQRVAAARALIGEPPLIIADEPTSALDEKSENAFIDFLFQNVHEKNLTLLMVSHDLRLKHYFDTHIDMKTILTHPQKGA